MKVVMVGTGYVGLVSGACFADFGHVVICVDKDESKIGKLRAGQVPFYEPGLQELVAKNAELGRLLFATSLPEAMPGADIVFIAVGTPSRRGDGHADLSYVEAAAAEIASAMDGFTVVVNKSTVPMGTGDQVEAIIAKSRSSDEFVVVSNPEFLREGSAVDDFKRPDRIVVGTDNQRVRDLMKELYRPLFLNETPIIFTGRRTAEITKYAANAFLATKITFINEIADLCEAAGADVQDVAKGMGLDGRIGRKFLHAGPGYGGSCFPKDTMALARTAAEMDVQLSIVNSVIGANNARKHRMAEKIVSACGGVQGKTIAVLGLTFKPKTDDMRDAPSLVIVPELLRKGAKIRSFDPEGMHEAMRLMPEMEPASDPYECAREADALVILTEWDQFRALDLKRLGDAMANKVIIDLRNIYDPGLIRSSGFQYVSIGR